jgi:D-arabinose 5-phosphate isomerase GutQ
MRRIDLEPAHCGDPECDADHGLTGMLAGDDLTVRISATGDGAAKVAQLIAFTSALQLATGTVG